MPTPRLRVRRVSQRTEVLQPQDYNRIRPNPFLESPPDLPKKGRLGRCIEKKYFSERSHLPSPSWSKIPLSLRLPSQTNPPRKPTCLKFLKNAALTLSCRPVTRPQIETSIKVFIVLLILAFIYAIYRVIDLIWLV